MSDQGLGLRALLSDNQPSRTRDLMIDKETLAEAIDEAIDWDYVEVFAATEEDEGFPGYPTYTDFTQAIAEQLMPLLESATDAAYEMGKENSWAFNNDA